jgi:transcriptional regulator with XRE-family HTH domain
MTEIDHKAIGWRLAVLRQRLGLDEREAARMAGVTPRIWRKWERGHEAGTESILKICRAFHCSIDWLVIGPAA